MFVIDQVYNRRRDIHAVYGGNWQSGICPSAKHPYIFIFSGGTGHLNGYADQWENDDIYSYTGEGQVGDMAFTKGNLALYQHLEKGKRVFLFEAIDKGLVQFKAELEFFDADYFEAPDRDGNIRQAIKFFFKRYGAAVNVSKSDLNYIQPELVIPTSTEKEGTYNQRIGQGAYRKSLILRWNGRCAVTGVKKREILRASHIKPWADSTNEERLDVNNGILLSPTYDALFDRHLISFEDNGSIILSDKVDNQDYDRLHVRASDKIGGLSEGNFTYLKNHRSKLIA